jgi:nucleotide-binding universal stress UspA family protein
MERRRGTWTGPPSKENTQMKRILVPLDGSEFAEGAVRPAEALAQRHGAEIHLASIVSEVPPAPLAAEAGELIAQWLDDEEKRLGEYLAKIRGEIAARSPALHVETHTQVGPVSRSLQIMADELPADLVVMTTHGRGAFQRAWLGSIADRMVRGVTHPLLLLKEGPDGAALFGDSGSPSRVLVPLDGSEAAEGALHAVRDLLGRGHPAHLMLASVVAEGFPLANVYLPHEVSDEAERRARKERTAAYLAKMAGTLGAAGLGPVETHVLEADEPAHGLLRFCETNGVDLIALSTHGRGGVSRFFLGSVADKLVRGTGIPVLVNRRSTDVQT